MMEKIQAWIEKHLVPVINKITSNFWFGIVADAVLFIVPFSMVSAIPSLWAILRRFVPGGTGCHTPCPPAPRR